MLIGRIRDAVELAKNMIELPQHPKFNALGGRGSASLGRDRLLGVLTTYRLWPQLIELANSVYLEPTTDEIRQDERNAWLAIAHSQSGNMTKCKELQSEMASLIAGLPSKAIEGRESLRILAEMDAKSNKKDIVRPPSLLQPYDLSEDPFGDDNDPAIPKMPSKTFDTAQAKEWSADLIVMGTHGRRGISRLTMGSDAEMVVRSAQIPVLLVRAADK